MTTFKTTVENFCNNDAVIEGVTVALTLYGWGETAVTSTVGAGCATRRWWESGASTETGHHGSWVFRQVAVIVYIAVMLCAKVAWSYFASGKAQNHVEIAGEHVAKAIPVAIEIITWPVNLMLGCEQPPVAEVREAAEKLSLPGDDLTDWAVARWPQLATLR